MKKINSKPLYTYLEQAGVLEADAATINKAKRAYRKEYKKQWQKEARKHQNEIRFNLSKAEYSKLKDYCKKVNKKLNKSLGTPLARKKHVTPTALLKELLKAHLNGRSIDPSRRNILAVHRQVGLLINRLHGSTQQVLKDDLLHLESLVEASLHQHSNEE